MKFELQKAIIRDNAGFWLSYPGGFKDPSYFSLERKAVWEAHLEWRKKLSRKEMIFLLDSYNYDEIVKRAKKIVTQSKLLSATELKALAGSVKTGTGAEILARELYDYLYRQRSPKQKFENLNKVLTLLPAKESHTVSWPIQTVFGFIAGPTENILVQPKVALKAAKQYGEPLELEEISWKAYNRFLNLAKKIRSEISDLKPKDFIDVMIYMRYS